MEEYATCARCGEYSALCQSVRMDGIKQPRVCKDCLIKIMTSGDETTNDVFWFAQMHQLKDEESINRIKKFQND